MATEFHKPDWCVSESHRLTSTHAKIIENDTSNIKLRRFNSREDNRDTHFWGTAFKINRGVSMNGVSGWIVRGVRFAENRRRLVMPTTTSSSTTTPLVAGMSTMAALLLFDPLGIQRKEYPQIEPMVRDSLFLWSFDDICCSPLVLSSSTTEEQWSVFSTIPKTSPCRGPKSIERQ